MKKVLILGAGMVVRPMVEYLFEQGYRITVTGLKKKRAEALIGGNPQGTAVRWSTDDPATLDQLVADHDITVSLLPYAYHVMVAGACLKHKKNLVTTSYVSEGMAALDEEARKAGVILLNEIGLDPGIDHMSAMHIIDEVRNKGGRLLEFYSITGALPAPEATDNPFRYKFSWSPKGVVMAGNNDARYLLDGKVKFVPTQDLFRDNFTIDFPGVGKMEVYPNRDSLLYLDKYGVTGARTFFRGTLRYPGWCAIMDAMKRIGLLSYEKIDLHGKSYAGMMALLIGEKDTQAIREKTAAFLEIPADDPVLDALEWLGLFSDQPAGREKESPFEVTSDLMIEKMMPGPDERDMIAMQHSFLVEYPGGKREVIHSRLLEFGSFSTHTAVSRAVALPAAIAVRLLLEGKIKATGVHRPVIPEIYSPVLEGLKETGIRITEEYGRPESDLPDLRS
jgi:saccharopine dehydrogenase-like NADP-dependent oxidoreductase